MGSIGLKPEPLMGRIMGPSFASLSSQQHCEFPIAAGSSSELSSAVQIMRLRIWRALINCRRVIGCIVLIHIRRNSKESLKHPMLSCPRSSNYLLPLSSVGAS